jgi:hypothetical protein
MLGPEVIRNVGTPDHQARMPAMPDHIDHYGGLLRLWEVGGRDGTPPQHEQDGDAEQCQSPVHTVAGQTSSPTGHNVRVAPKAGLQLLALTVMRTPTLNEAQEWSIRGQKRPAIVTPAALHPPTVVGAGAKV